MQATSDVKEKKNARRPPPGVFSLGEELVLPRSRAPPARVDVGSVVGVISASVGRPVCPAGRVAVSARWGNATGGGTCARVSSYLRGGSDAPAAANKQVSW